MKTLYVSDNFRMRQNRIDMIVVHSMGENIKGKFAPEFLESIGLSCHFYIKPNGEIIQGVEDVENMVAFHAGESKWGEETNLNKNSIGIELLVQGNHTWSSYREEIKKPSTFTRKHKQSLEMLCKELMKDFPLITYDRIVEHKDISGKDVRPNDPKVDVGEGWDHDSFVETLKSKLEEKFIKPEVIDKSNKQTWQKLKEKSKDFLRTLF